MTGTVALDARPHVAAFAAVINPGLGAGGAQVWTSMTLLPGQARAKTKELRDAALPPMFVTAFVERRFTPYSSLSGEAGVVAWRAIIRSMGTTEDEVRWLQMQVGAALNEVSLSISDAWTTPLQHEDSESPVWDEGRYSARDFFTYAIAC